MMIKPSIEELTNKSNCNRYTLVIASAKSARYVTAKQKLKRDEGKFESADALSQSYAKQPLRRDLYEVKPTTAGIELIHNGDFHIVNPTTGNGSNKE